MAYHKLHGGNGMNQNVNDRKTMSSILEAKIYQLEIEKENILKQLQELERKVEYYGEKKWEFGYRKFRLQTILERINRGVVQYRDSDVENLEISYYDACELEKGAQRVTDFYVNQMYDFSMKESDLSKKIENASDELNILQGKETSLEISFSKQKKAFFKKNNSTKNNI